MCQLSFRADTRSNVSLSLPWLPAVHMVTQYKVKMYSLSRPDASVCLTLLCVIYISCHGNNSGVLAQSNNGFLKSVSIQQTAAAAVFQSNVFTQYVAGWSLCCTQLQSQLQEHSLTSGPQWFMDENFCCRSWSRLTVYACVCLCGGQHPTWLSTVAVLWV